MNLLEKAINETMDRMSESGAACFLEKIGKMAPAQVNLLIGKYWEHGTLMIVAEVEGKKVAECGVLALLAINEHYKRVYLTQEMRQAIKAKLNQHKEEIVALF